MSFLLSVGGGLLLAWSSALAAPLSPDGAVALALPVHPEVARAEAELATARGESRETLIFRENPEIDGAYGLTGDRLEASASQALSLTGEGLAAHRSARARLAAAESALQRARLEAASEVRHAWIAAVVAGQSAALAADAFALAVRLYQATEAKLAAGEVAELDVRLARMAQAGAARDLLDARTAEAEALATLSALVQRPVVAEDLPGAPLQAAPAPGGGQEERSDVAAARAAVEAAEAELARARASILPPVRVGAFAEVEDGAIVAGPSLGLTLPLWHQNQSQTGAARGALAAARATLGATEARAEAERRVSAALVQEASGVADQLGPSLAGDAEAALASIERGFAAGELDLMETVFLRAEVVDGQTALLETQGRLAELRVDALLADEDPALLGGAP